MIDQSSKSSESTESIPANTDKGTKKKKGKSASMKTATVETVPDDEEDARPKSKRNQKKGRDSSSSQKLDSKSGGKKESVKAQEGNNFIPPDEWVMKKIADSVPEFEDEGTSEKVFLCAFNTKLCSDRPCNSRYVVSGRYGEPRFNSQAFS